MVDEKAIRLLKELSESFGPAGFERETAKIVKRNVKPYADEISQDKLGSIIFKHQGRAKRPRVLIAGHIDKH